MECGASKPDLLWGSLHLLAHICTSPKTDMNSQKTFSFKEELTILLTLSKLSRFLSCGLNKTQYYNPLVMAEKFGDEILKRNSNKFQ